MIEKLLDEEYNVVQDDTQIKEEVLSDGRESEQ
jgi:hypothetical protein